MVMHLIFPRFRFLFFGLGMLIVLGSGPHAFGAEVKDLQVGIAGHAFDHLGSIGDQAEAAAASGATIIYVSGLGGLGYEGLPTPAELRKQRQNTLAYIRGAKHKGIRLAIGYVCATSIVHLETFDKNWPPELRARFRTPPAAWRQQDSIGKPLPSWYGGSYQPACMNNPDWRAYEKFMVQQQLEAGCDGIFFDNPTVHPQGCFCPACMQKFEVFLKQEGVALVSSDSNSVTAIREAAKKYPEAFLRFRCTIARDFLAEMRSFARSNKHGALVTANNSLNSPGALYSQCRSYAYNIDEMSKAEDLVVVEDMMSQPRLLPDGKVFEYTPTYKQLRAISHDKPVVAVTIAEADYHTPPNLTRLAMAEAAANGASYLSWPTWPEKERARMISALRPEADFLRQHAGILNDVRPRRDLHLFLPFRNWLKADHCRASDLAAELARANVQFEVVCENDLLGAHWPAAKALLATTRADFNAHELEWVDQFSRQGGALVTAEKPNWLEDVRRAVSKPSVLISGASNVRALVCDQKDRTLVHLLNLNIHRLSSFEDKVTPISDLRIAVRVPRKKVRSVQALTGDSGASSGALHFSATPEGVESLVVVTVPRLEIATILSVQ